MAGERTELDAEVAVVGAGFAGLTAARRLMGAGSEVAVLEARERVGGRVKAGTLAGGAIDLGGMWLGPTQRRLAALAKHTGAERYPTPLAGDAVVELGGRVARAPGEAAVSALSREELEDFGELVRRVEELAARIDPHCPWASEDAEALDRTTVGSWLAAHARTAGARSVFRTLVGAVFCAEPQEMSTLWMLTYLRAAGGLGVLLSAGEGGAQNILFRGSLHGVAARLAEELGPRVHLGEEVRRLAWDAEGARLETGRGAWRARRVVLALPPPLLGRIDFEPMLPSAAAALHDRLAMGSVIKCWVGYERPFWRERGLNGFVLSDGAPFSPFFDVTPPGHGGGVLAGFFDGDRALAWSGRSAEERRACVAESVARFLGEEGRRPVDYAENDWTRERFSGGCYGAYAPPGTLTRFGRALRAPAGSLHFAGTETATEWTGYVEGALQSGERAAEEVLRALER